MTYIRIRNYRLKMRLPSKFGTLCLLLLWRLTSVFVVQTAYVPDEYWQSLEVAHYLAFGYGYLTWEWTMMIRSYIYPFLISILYRILAILSLDSVSLLTILPRIFQASLTAYGDYRFYNWTNYNKSALFALCSNWYWYYCTSRTLVNTVETVGTIVSLSIFPWPDSRLRSTNFLWIIGFLFMIRPTTAIIWFPLCLFHICTSPEKKVTLIGRYIIICCSCFLISTLIDSYCYGKLVIVPLKFFQMNVLQNIGETYGREHVLWYMFFGLPVILGLYCIPYLMSVKLILKHPDYFVRELFIIIVIVWTLFIYSLLPHKELRFILPLLPMLIYISSICFYRFKTIGRKNILVLLICSNLIPGFYFSVIHQRGTLNVVKQLRDEISANPLSANVLILTPCHATPLYSHLHVNASIKFLTCEPNFNNSKNYLDEADQFFSNPAFWLNNNYVNNKSVMLPSYIIVFDKVANKITDFLSRYKLIAEVFHTHFPQSNYGRYLLLYKLV